MAIDAAERAKTPAARSSVREGDGALSPVGLIALTIAGIGVLALFSILGSRAVVTNGGETDQAKPTLFCPLHGSTFDWTPALAPTDEPGQG